MQRVKFATQADPDLLAELRTIAETEGRQLQMLIDEALRDLIEKRRNTRARPHVMASFEKMSKKRDWLYTQLAK